MAAAVVPVEDRGKLDRGGELARLVDVLRLLVVAHESLALLHVALELPQVFSDPAIPYFVALEALGPLLEEFGLRFLLLFGDRELLCLQAELPVHGHQASQGQLICLF